MSIKKVKGRDNRSVLYVCFCVCYLDVSHHSGGLHSAGHIDRVAPDVIVRFTSSNHSSQNSSLIQTWRVSLWKHGTYTLSTVHANRETNIYMHTHTHTHWPIRSMKLLKDCLLRLLRVTFIAKAKSARSARCCQRSISDWSSGCGTTAYISHVDHHHH